MRRSPALLVAAVLAAASAPRRAWADDATAGQAAATPGVTATTTAAPASAETPAATPAATAAPAAAAPQAPAPAETAVLTPTPPASAPEFRGLGREHLPRFGLSLGGGFPDLANANLLFRPVNWARLYAGPCWGYVSWGLQGGVVVAPWNGVATPTLSFQAGELFSSNLTRFVKSDSQSAQDVKPLLAHVDYRYLAGDLGLELGSPRSLSFYLRLGLSYVVIKANGTATHVADDGTRVTVRDPSVRAWLPSLKLGFQYWL